MNLPIRKDKANNMKMLKIKKTPSSMAKHKKKKDDLYMGQNCLLFFFSSIRYRYLLSKNFFPPTYESCDAVGVGVFFFTCTAIRKPCEKHPEINT